jgi:DNA-binding winged helix-turn-helix (wHTH) protein
MPPLKAKIVDALKVAGAIGCSREDLVNAVWGGKIRAADTIKAHIQQLRDLLAETEWDIGSEGRGKNHRWILYKA